MKIFDYPWMALILASLVPVAFFYSNNGNIYPLAAIVTGMAVAILIGLILFIVSTLAGYAISRVFGGSGPSAERRRRVVYSIAYAVSTSFIILFLSHPTWRTAVPPGVGRVLLFVGPVAAFFLLIYKSGFRVLNYIFAVSILVSVGTIAKNEIANLSDPYGLSGGKWEEMRFGNTLARKPNIYLFLMESYHPQAYLKERFGVDFPFFFDFLNENSFRIPNNYITNYCGTVPASTALLEMRHHYGTSAFGRDDVGRKLRNVLATNRTFRFLKSVGYAISIFDVNAYLFRASSEFIDHTNYQPVDSLAKQVMDSYAGMQKKFMRLLRFIGNDAVVMHRNPMEDFLNTYEKQILREQPAFTFYHFGAFHSDGLLKVKDWPGEMAKFRSAYLAEYEKSATALIPILERIISSDPESLIILVGDHGSYSYLARNMLDPQAKSIEDGLADLGLTQSMVARDWISVISAIRWPASMEAPEFPEEGLSHVRLMPYVFSALNNVPFHGDDYGANDAYEFTTKIAENGIPLETWRETHP